MSRWQLRLRQTAEQFWFIPALMTVAALLGAELGISLEERYGIPGHLSFVYAGGESGARSVLAAISSSSIGVAGTIFSITIAALSYAAGSMGPRLLDNFTRDRGNQLVLGVFIATFAFSLYSLRTVTGGEPGFVPHYNVTVALALALTCIAALVYYLAHVTASINMTHVVNLLRDDLVAALEHATEQREDVVTAQPPAQAFWDTAETLRSPVGGYLQHIDTERLVRLAAEHQAVIRLHVKPGDYVFVSAAVASAVPRLPPGVMKSLTLGQTRIRGQDLEYSVRQLAEVAARALSPGVNDPVTAVDVIDRFGDALCRLHDRQWPDGLHFMDGQLRLWRPTTSFGSLLDSMFTMIRQYGKGSPVVMAHLLEVLATVAECNQSDSRHWHIQRHADLAYHDALKETGNPADRAQLTQRYGAVKQATGEC